MVQNCRSNGTARLNQHLNLLLHHIGTFAPDHHVQGRHCQADDQNCGGPGEDDNCCDLPADPAPDTAESGAHPIGRDIFGHLWNRCSRTAKSQNAPFTMLDRETRRTEAELVASAYQGVETESSVSPIRLTHRPTPTTTLILPTSVD